MSDKNDAKKNTFVKRGLFVTAAVALAVAVISVVMNLIMPPEQKADSSFDKSAWEEAVRESETVAANAKQLPENVKAAEPKKDLKKEIPDEKEAPAAAVPTASLNPENENGNTAIEIALMKPVEGNVTKAYSGEEPAYSETMQDWRIHEGIDLAAPNDTEVKAAADGKVEKVTADGMLGTVVIINHGGDIKTLCANLAEDPPVTEGQEIKMGDVIGKIGSTATLEIAETPHLHFEVMKGDKTIDPAFCLPDMEDQA